MNLTLEMKLRASSVTRWHIVRTSVRQSLAEHAYNTAMLTDHVLRELQRLYGMYASWTWERMRHRGTLLALNHDGHEVLTGDAPSTFKKWLEKHGHVDHTKLPDLYLPLPTITGVVGAEELVDAVVGFCDKLDAHQFMEKYAVDHHGYKVRERLAEKLASARDWMPVIELACHNDGSLLHNPPGWYKEQLLAKDAGADELPVWWAKKEGTNGVPTVNWNWFVHRVSADIFSETKEIIDEPVGGN